MERWELMNKALMPLDDILGLGLDALKKAGYYAPFRDGLYETARSFMRKNLEKQNDLKVSGLENVPKTGGCLIAINHQSWLDVQVVTASSPRRYYFIAKAEFKDWPFLRRMIEMTDGLYIRRGGDDKGLEDVVNALKSGKAVAVFPEGTIPGEEDIPRWEVEKDTGLLRGKSGVVRLALAAGVPIIPCGVTGTGKAWPPEAYPRLQQWPPLAGPGPVSVKYGKPIEFAKPRRKPSRAELEKKTKKVMLAISSLVDHSKGFVPMTLPLNGKTEPTSLPRFAFSRPAKPGKECGKAPLGVLVLHGFTSDIHCVDALVKPLDEMGVPYRFPVLRGHGTTFQDMEGTTHQDWYEDAENALLDLYREADQVAVVGLSMGGLVALELGARHRDKVGGLVTVAAALRFADPLAPVSPLMSKFIRFWPSPDAYTDKALRDKENRNYPKFSTKAFGCLLEYSKTIPDILSFVKAPILILQSSKDTVVAPRAAKVIYSKVSSKDRSLVWFEKSGHEMLLDCEAGAVVDAAMNFIGRLSR